MVSMVIPRSNHYAIPTSLAQPPLKSPHQHCVNQKSTTWNLRTARPALRLGFVPLADCAPIIVAQEFGLFLKYGLRVALTRELGWATIRDRIIHGEIDAAHALAPMPVAATLGLGSAECPCLTALVLNLNGNAITLSNELVKAGIRNAAGLRGEVVRLRDRKTFTFGMVSPYSSHNYLLRKWLLSGGLNPDRDVRIVTVPPPQMVANLKAGHLDGFCVGEPWSSLAVQSHVGGVAAVSAELQPGHPEKVLMVRKEFAERRPEEHLALVAALREACEFCELAENRDRILPILSESRFVNVRVEVLRRGFERQFDFGHGLVRAVPDFCIFHRTDSNAPTPEKAAWVFEMLRAVGLSKDPSALSFALGRETFRNDLYEQAMRPGRPQEYEHENQIAH